MGRSHSVREALLRRRACARFLAASAVVLAGATAAWAQGRGHGRAGGNPGGMILLLVVGGGISLVVLGASMTYLRRRRLMENTPTIPIRGAFIGMVELKGTAESPQPVRSCLAGVDCVYYAYEVQEHWSRTTTEHYTDKDGKRRTRTKTESGWKTVGEGGHDGPFYLQDGTGSIRVLPRGAVLTGRKAMDRTCGRGDPMYYGKGPAGSISHSTHDRRFTETVIPLHHPLYLLGHARLRSDAVELEVAKDDSQSTYLISTDSEESITSRAAWAYRVLTVLWIAAAGATAWLAAHFGDGRGTAEAWRLLTLAAAGAMGAWLIGWMWVVYNSLCDLRHRLDQAWSNVDVQLQRRSDLIPNLVNIVMGLRQHEAETQAALAALRSQTGIRKPGQHAQAVAGSIVALKEAYPELTANAIFAQLQEELANTENLIAMAREYYNGVVGSCRQRAAMLPDRFLAAHAGVRAVPFFQAEGFERKAHKISMAE